MRLEQFNEFYLMRLVQGGQCLCRLFNFDIVRRILMLLYGVIAFSFCINHELLYVSRKTMVHPLV